MTTTWVLIVLFLGDPAPRPPIVMPTVDKAFCEAVQYGYGRSTKEGITQFPPHVSWCVQWPKDVPAPVRKDT